MWSSQTETHLKLKPGISHLKLFSECEMCRTYQTIVAGFPNAGQRHFVNFSQMFGRGPKMSGRTQKVFVIAEIIYYTQIYQWWYTLVKVTGKGLVFVGTLLIIKKTRGCDTVENPISFPLQIVPYFVMDVLNYPGFPGIFLAVLFSGALR